MTRPKLGYVGISELYIGFDMTKEMQAKYDTTSSAREKILDSLESKIMLIENTVSSKVQFSKSDTAGYQNLVNEYLLQKKTFDEDNTTLSKENDKKIITKLNQYVSDYGKKHGYTYILGTGGNGSLMYADDAENITQDMIDYLNLRYSGEKGEK
jgi:outer membrane protein